MWKDGKLLFLATSCQWQPDGTAETHFWAKESHGEGAVAFVTDKLSQGAYNPPGGGREVKEEWQGERKRTPVKVLWKKKKLAVSCRGMGGETEMDTHNPAKSSWWVEAYCAFSQTSKTADCLLASLWVLFRIDDVPDLIVAYKQRQTMFMRTELMAKHAHVRPQSIICLSREVQSYSGLRRKYLKAMFIIYTLCKTST